MNENLLADLHLVSFWQFASLAVHQSQIHWAEGQEVLTRAGGALGGLEDGGGVKEL